MSKKLNVEFGRFRWLVFSCCLLAVLSSSALGQTRGNRLDRTRTGGIRLESKILNNDKNAAADDGEYGLPGDGGKLVTGKVLMRSGKPVSVEYMVKNGRAFYQGDIMLGNVDSQNRVTGARNAFQRANVAKDWYRWPDGVIPYEIHSSLRDPSIIILDRLTNQRMTIKEGVELATKRWTDQTNVTMRPRLTTDKDYVRFRLNADDDGTSWSRLGREGGRQDIQLDDGSSVRTILHEIGHTAGLWHEQSREDRDRFIRVEWDNIKDDDRIKHQFKIQSDKGDLSGPYDYDSIMHYRGMIRNFAKDPSKPVITPLNGVSLSRIGRQPRLSQGDIAAINAFYPKPQWTGSVPVPGQSTKAGPAMAVFQSRLYMVHLGKSSNNIYYSYFDGSRWSTEKQILGQKSKATPALAVYRGRLHMVHLGDSSNDIWYSTFDGSSWTKNVKIGGQKSKRTPALATFGNELHMVHLGDSSNDIWHSRFGRQGWTKNVRIAGQKSKATPALAVYQNRLRMVHLGDRSNDIWYSTYNGRSWSTNVKVNSQQSKVAPSLTMFDGKLYMFHLGNSSNDIWYSEMDQFGKFRPNIRVPRQQSSHSVAVAEFADQLIMVYKGVRSTKIYKTGYAEFPPVQITSTNRRGKSGRRVTTGTGRKLQLKR